MVTVLFFGRLKEELGVGQHSLELTAATDVAGLKAQLLAAQPAWQELLLDDRVLVAVDQVMATNDSAVGVQAEVAFFPPVTGG